MQALIHRILAALKRGQAQHKHQAAKSHLARMWAHYEDVEIGMLAAIKGKEVARRELKSITRGIA